MSPWRMRNKEGKSAVMILALKGKMPLEILQGSCVHVIVRARNLLGAVQERSQGKLLTSCKTNPCLLHPVRIQQGGALLMTYVLVLLLVCKLSTPQSSATTHIFQGSRDPELFLDSKLRWKETIISRTWLLGRLARRKYTNMRNVKDLSGDFGASFMKTFIPQF